MRRCIRLEDNMGMPLVLCPDDVYLVRQALSQPNQESPLQKWEGHSVLFMTQMPGQGVFVKGEPANIAAQIFGGVDG